MRHFNLKITVPGPGRALRGPAEGGPEFLYLDFEEMARSDGKRKNNRGGKKNTGKEKILLLVKILHGYIRHFTNKCYHIIEHCSYYLNISNTKARTLFLANYGYNCLCRVLSAGDPDYLCYALRCMRQPVPPHAYA